MAYRVNVQFRDLPGPVADVIDAPLPRRGDTIVIARRGLPVSVRIIAIWTPSTKLRGDGLVMVEVKEL